MATSKDEELKVWLKQHRWTEKDGFEWSLQVESLDFVMTRDEQRQRKECSSI
jgi:hypothetical protein